MNKLNWYPGHMAKSFRLLASELGRVHLVLECCDARIPETSRNPKIAELIAKKDHIVILSKSDLVSAEQRELWLQHFKEQGVEAHAVNLKAPGARKTLEKILRPFSDQLAARDKMRGRRPRPLTIACLGIPNVGKSTLGNLLLGKNSHATENRPGLTRGITFIASRDKRYELMDSPGLLWPKLETREEQAKLAICMAIPDRILPLEELALDFIYLWSHVDPRRYQELMGMPPAQNKAEMFLALENYGRAAGLLQKGGEVDLTRAADRLLHQMRGGKLGEICLELPGQEIILPDA